MIKTKEAGTISLLEMKFECWWNGKYRNDSKLQSLEYTIAKDAWMEAVKTKEAIDSQMLIK